MKKRIFYILIFLFALAAGSLIHMSGSQAAPPNFVNEILITNLNEPIVLQFLPGGRMLVVGRLGTIWVAQPGANQIDPIPFIHLPNISNNANENGVFSVTLDPNFAQNQHFYVFYTAASPFADRVSRFTANGNTANAATEVVIWQDTAAPGVTHHGGSIGFGPDGMLYISTGEHFMPSLAQQLDTFRGKILRLRSDGTAPSDNPFYVGNNQPRDYIWALGLRNPFRISFDRVSGRLYIGDVGGNIQSTAIEEVNLGVAGANYGWPICEGPCNDSNITDPIFSYPHGGQHASITGGFVYRGTQFPSQYHGSYFYGDYERNFIKGVTLNASGQVIGSFNFEPTDGSPNGPYGNITYLTEGPDGALYYVDYNYDASGNATSPGSIRRLRYTAGNQPPAVVASANPTSGTAPLTVNFSSAGTVDPENNPLTYTWDFGDGANSSLPNPSHTYLNDGPYTARLTVSDGNSQIVSNPISINVGNVPAVTISSPANGAFFIAGDTILFSGSAFDAEDGQLPPGSLSWLIVFHHGTHTHPILGPLSGSSGSFTIPSNGHDYSGETNYEIILKAVDSDGLQSARSVFIFPRKVNLTFNTNQTGLNFFLDGVSTPTPITLDTVIGFEHTIQAPDQTINGVVYTFQSWSDGGARAHTIITPNTDRTYTAIYTATVQSPLLQTSFDNLAAVQNPVSGTGAGANVNTAPANDFIPAQVGNGIRIDAGNESVRFLQMSGATQNVELDQGTVDFWYRPNGVHTDGAYRSLVSFGKYASPGSIHIRKNNGSNGNVFGVTAWDASGTRVDTDILPNNYSFTPGVPVNIRVTWDFTVGQSVINIHIYFNGVELPPSRVSAGTRPMPAERSTRFIYVGDRGDNSGLHGNGVFDELVIFPSAITPNQSDTVPPQRSNGQPTGALAAGTTSATISLMTNESATCKYSTTSGVVFDSMPNSFSTSGGTMHSSVVSGLSNGGSYTYYVRCRDDAGNTNTDDFNISFTVNSGQPTNQAPVVNAGPDQTITLPASASLSGTATDDGLPSPPGALTTTWSKVSGPGTVTFGDANSLNTTASFSSAGTYMLRLTGNDGALSATDDVTITVNSSAAGLLAGSVATPASSVNLSLEGTSDWAHWGLTSATSFNHKSGVTQKISNFTKIGSGGVLRYGGGSFSYSWTGGTPTASALNTTAGVWRGGVGNGFQITVPADTTDRTLRLHVGVSNAQGRLEVSLSDGSAAPYINTLDDVVPMGNTHAVYTINFRAASAGRTVTVKWTAVSISSSSGNVTLQAATLADGLLASHPVTHDQSVYFKRTSAMSALSLLGVLADGTKDEQRR